MDDGSSFISLPRYFIHDLSSPPPLPRLAIKCPSSGQRATADDRHRIRRVPVMAAPVPTTAAHLPLDTVPISSAIYDLTLTISAAGKMRRARRASRKGTLLTIVTSVS